MSVTLESVSINNDGELANNGAFQPHVSANGRFVTFASTATNLVTGDNFDERDIFVYDRDTNVIERVSVNNAGQEFDFRSDNPSISGDGRFVVFQSEAPLVAGDNNAKRDIFVCDRQTDTVERVSVGFGGAEVNGDSRDSFISSDGRYVAFTSAATNLVAGGSAAGVFVYDRQTGITERIAEGSTGFNSSLSGDGRFVAFHTNAALVAADGNGISDVYVYDRQTHSFELISADNAGNEGDGGSDDAAISADGRFVSFSSDADNLVPGVDGGVFLYDRQTDTIVSVAENSLFSSISGDGRYVTFTSSATDLADGPDYNDDGNDTFLYDRVSGTIIRLSESPAGTNNGENFDSQFSVISADGSTVAFASNSTDIAPNTNANFNKILVTTSIDFAPGTTTPTVALAQHQVNAAGPLDHSEDPKVIGLSNGDYRIAWFELARDSNGNTIGFNAFTQLYDPLGQAIGTKVQLDLGSRVVSVENGAAFAATGDGGFVMTFVSEGSVSKIYRQYFDEDLNTSGPVRTSPVDSNDRYSPSIATAGDGEQLIAYEKRTAAGTGIVAQIVSADGSTASAEMTVRDPFLGAASLPDVAALSNGDYVVAFSERIAFNAARFAVIDGDSGTIVGVITAFDSNSNPQDNVRVASLAGGGFVGVWTEDGDVHARIFSIGQFGASAIGDAFTVNTSVAGIQSVSDVIRLADGSFVVVWYDSQLGQFVGQRVDMYGGRIGNEFVAGNADGTGESSAALGQLSDGRFVSAFRNTDDDADDAYATIFDARNHTVAGTSADDVLTARIGGGILIGNNGNDRLIGSATGDDLRGGVGDDTLVGGAGNDLLDGGAGNDTASYAGAIQSVTVNLAAASNHASGAEIGTDQIVNVENVTGGSGNDTIAGDGNANTLDGGMGADTMVGGLGNDTYVVDSQGDVVAENANEGADTVNASINYILPANVENLTQTGTADLQGYGNALANTLTGNSGNSLLNGGAGADVMYGGAGNDVYFIDDAADAVFENANEGNDTEFATANFALLPNIENLILQGAADLQGYGNGLNNVLYGNTGNNLLNGNGGADLMAGGLGDDVYFIDDAADAVFENANAGNDTEFATANFALLPNIENLILQGSANLQGYGNGLANVLYGNTGNNLLNGGAGVDLMAGGLGDDVYYVDDPSDACFEVANQGNDSVFATCSYGLAADVESLILQGAGDFQAYGSSQANTIYGNAGNNLINGGAGADFMAGGAGGDVYFVDNVGDGILENANEGNDAVLATVSYALSANVEGLVLQGAGNIDGTGNAIANIISGNAGNNMLDGGGAADQLTGNGGNDTFVFKMGEANGDTIVDFAGNGAATGDALQFAGYGAGATFTNIDATHWQVNYNGGSAHDIITFANGASIDAQDFQFI